MIFYVLFESLTGEIKTLCRADSPAAFNNHQPPEGQGKLIVGREVDGSWHIDVSDPDHPFPVPPE